MRKLIALMSIMAIVFAMCLPVRAADKTVVIIKPGLSFSGTTATCSLKVYAEHATDSIKASVVLKHGNTVVEQWLNLTDDGFMNFSDTANVAHGETYTMQVTVKVNGVSHNVADITKTCP